MQKKVYAVVVAWNRATLLTQVLHNLADQTYPLAGIVVVNNASTDDTSEVIAKSAAVTDAVTLPQNFGGAGGFAAGIARAVNAGADYVWIMDDDTIPQPNTLEILLNSWEKLATLPALAGKKKTEIGLLACRADWIDGREHPMNKPRLLPFAEKTLVSQAAKLAAYPVRTCSFVGPLISAKAVREVGLPIADYFLWNDDFEYTARILKNRIGFYVDTARVEHRTKTFGNSATSPGQRFFNEVRNKFWMYYFSKSLTPFEKILYGGKTTLRWLKLFATAPDRKVLAHCFWRGIKASRKRPQTNSQVLSQTPAINDVLKIERESQENKRKNKRKYHRSLK